MTPLADEIYEHLRPRIPSSDGRITYGDLVNLLSNSHGISSPRDVRLYSALGEIVQACRDNSLPIICALVVLKDDNGQLSEPGPGYYPVAHSETGSDDVLRSVAWAREWARVQQTTYPQNLT